MSTGRYPNVHVVAIGCAIQALLSERGVHSYIAVQGDMLELGYAMSAEAIRRQSNRCCMVAMLDVPHARRLSQELERVPSGETSRSASLDAITRAMFEEEAPTTSHHIHHFEPGMRVEVVVGIHKGRRGNIHGKAFTPSFGWAVYLDSPKGTKTPAKGRRRALRHFLEGELVQVQEEGTEKGAALQAGQAYLAGVKGWTDGAGRKAIRAELAEHPRLGAIYQDAYARGQRASREEAERVAANFGYKPAMVAACGG